MLSKIAFSIFIVSCFQWTGAMNPLSLTDTSANPIETLFGDGYICLHITDPIFESSPSFQALAVELAKRFNKSIPIVHKIGSNETVPHTEAPDTVHYVVDETTTALPPPIAALTKKELKCEEEGFFTNPNNCTKFYRCVEQTVRGKPFNIVEFDCPEFTIFDPTTKVCSNPWDVEPMPDCVLSDQDIKGMRGRFPKKKPVPEDEKPDGTGQEQVTEEPVTESPTTPEVTDEGTVETNECTMGGLFSDENDCHQYYQCIREGTGFRMLIHICEHKMIFDPVTEDCLRPQEVDPKPACWHKRKHIKKIYQVNETVEITEDYTKPVEPEPETDGPPGEPEPEQEGPTTEPPEDFDEFDSTGTTQLKKTPTTIHKTIKNTTVTEEIIDIQEGVTEPSEVIHGKRKRITIPRPVGPKPIPQCEMEGTFPHPTECTMYMKCVKRGKAHKIYFFPCMPNGTVFNADTHKCEEPRITEPNPPGYPECAPWDDALRPIFEKILNEEVDEVTTTELPVVPPVDQVEETTPKPDEPGADIEYSETDDGKGGKHIVKRVNTTTEETVDIVINPGEDVPSTHIDGKHVVNTTHPGEIDSPPAVTEDYEDEVTTSTGAPAPLKEPEPTPKEIEPSFEKPDETVEKLPCEDEVELVKRLTLERDEALSKLSALEAEHAAKMSTCEKELAKKETHIKKMQKELGIAKKDKQKYENYISSMDKTIDAYKEEVAWYLQHCPQPTDFVEDDEDGKGVKSRKRRSLDTSITPLVAKAPRRHHLREDFHLSDSVDSKRSKVRKFREFKPRPIHVTSETVHDDGDIGRSPFPTYDEQSAEEFGSMEEEAPLDHNPHRERPRGHSHVTGRHGPSHWSPDSEGSFLLAQIPLLIFTVLAILLITISLLGCMVVRRLNRMTTFTVSELDDASSYSPTSYRRRGGRRFGSSEKLRHV